ncbi:MAG: methylmalonyl-CoA mutase family protein [Leptospirales bacterium]
MYVHGRTSRWNQTVYDPHVNLLRATTETMSAALGACDAFTVLPFDFARSPDATDDLGARLARNTQQVIKHEAYLDKVVDPAAGSYYLETLTDRIAKEGWALFQEIESAGGYLKAFANMGPSPSDSGRAIGLIQARVKASADRSRQAVASRKQTVLGTNQYPNGKERASDSIKTPADRPLPAPGGAARMPAAGVAGDEQAALAWIRGLPAIASKHGVGAVIADLRGAPDLKVEALQSFRAADEFEALRLATEARVAGGKAAPKVFLIGYGDLAMRKARSMFAANFFTCAGYEIIDSAGDDSIDGASAGARAALQAGADIVVFCSSDAEYDQAVDAAKIVRAAGAARVVIAGNPADHVDALRAAGVQHFIHARSNALAELQGFHKELGV